MIINRVIDNAAVAAASLDPRARRRGPRAGARRTPSRSAATARRCSAVDGARQPRVGGVGERGRRARARLPRHVPRGRVLAPGRQHPADPRGRPARRAPTGRDLVRGIATGYEIQIDLVQGDLPAQAQDRPRRPPRPVGRGRHRHAARPRRSRRSTRPSARRCTPRPPRGSRARARSRRGRRTPPRSPARWPSRRSTARCAARPAPSPIYEGEDGVIAWLLDGPDAAYEVPLPDAGRGQARHPRLVHEGALGRVPGAGVDRPRPQAARRAPASLDDPAQRRVDRAAHQPPHALRDRLGRERPAEVRPDRVARDARPLDPVHLHGRAAGRRLAPRRLVRARARRPRPTPSRCGTRSPPPRTPSGRAATTRTTRPRRRSAARVVITLADGGEIVDEIAVADAHPLGARPFAREDYVAQVPHARRAGARRRGRDRAVPRRSPQRLPELDRRRARPAHDHRRRPACSPRRRARRACSDRSYCTGDHVLYSTTAGQKQRRLPRASSPPGSCSAFPGAFNPLSARLIEEKGFEGVYISGAVLAADLGLPDIGLTTLTEVAGRGQQIARMTELPAIIDADTGFGEPMNVARTHPDPRGRRPRRLPHRGPDQPQALRPPRRQGGRRRGHRDQAHPRRRRRAPRPELPHHGAHRHPRRRRAGGGDRPREGAGRRRSRRDLPRGDARPRGVRRRSAPRSTCRCSPT